MENNDEMIELPWTLERELRVFAEDVIMWHKGECHPIYGHPDNFIPFLANKIREKIANGQ